MSNLVQQVCAFDLDCYPSSEGLSTLIFGGGRRAPTTYSFVYEVGHVAYTHDLRRFS